MSKLMRFVLGVSLAIGAAVAPAMAQDFPTRVVTLVVPFPAGGGGDTTGRFIAEGMSEILGMPVIVDNRPGGGTLIGAEYVRNAQPDGYTLFLTSNSYVINSMLGEGGDSDPLTGLEPVAFVSNNRFVLVANKHRGFATLADLIAYAKENPEELMYANHGVNTGSDIFARDFAEAAGIEIRQIPYSGSAAANIAVIGGEADLTTASTLGVKSHVEAGDMIALGILAEEHDDLLPGVPTLAEEGVDASDFGGAWFGVSTTAGTPAEVVEVLHQAIADAFAMDSHRTRLSNAGHVVSVSTPEEFRARIAHEASLLERFVE